MSYNDVPIRASLLRGLPALVSEFGGQGDEFLEAYGVDAEAIGRRDAFISFRLLERIFEDAAREVRTVDFGLRMAAQQDLQVLGPLGIAMANSRTVGDGLACAQRFLFVFSPAISQTVIPDPLGNPGVVGIRFASSTVNAPQVIDYGLGIVHRVVGMLHGGERYGLRSVLLPHPRIATDGAYRDYFGAEVAFDCAEAVLRVPRQVMDVPIAGADDLLHDLATDFLETRFSHQNVPISELISAILDNHVGTEPPDLATVAEALDLHPRSVQRLLLNEGVGFKELVDGLRRRQTLNLITTTNLSLSQIAVRVGFREQSSLSRAVRRWFGVPPSTLRTTGPACLHHHVS